MPPRSSCPRLPPRQQSHSHASCSATPLGWEVAGSTSAGAGRWVAWEVCGEPIEHLQRRDPVRDCPAHRIRYFLQALVAAAAAAAAAARSACRRSMWRSRSRRPRRRPSSRPLVSSVAASLPLLISLVLLHVGTRQAYNFFHSPATSSCPLHFSAFCSLAGGSSGTFILQSVHVRWQS